jgi:hypothetical protein
MLFGYLTLFTALIISLSAAVYSILGLTAVFAAAFWPIVVLGGSLEVGKIVTTLWLHKYWDRAEIQYKLYLCSAVAILMLLTSMGVFGFLSKAHLDQAIPSGDVAAKVQIFDDKIKTQQDNIKAARAALTQMDAAVDQTMSRSTTEQGADKAANLRRSQARERTALQNDISKAQKEITALQEQRAPIASEMRKVEAEVGPIKYIAALIYGDNPEANTLEKAVRWVIILIVIVFDPLALTLLLAATKSLEWERGINILAPKKRDDEDSTSTSPVDDLEPVFDREDIPLEEPVEKKSRWAGFGFPMLSIFNKKEDPEIQEFFDRAQDRAQAIDAGTYQAPAEPIEQLVIDDNNDERPGDYVTQEEPAFTIAPTDPESDLTDKEARRRWKDDNPNDTLHRQEELFNAGTIKELPWKNPKYMFGLEADNIPKGPTGEVRGFGTTFPQDAVKGDMYLRVDRLPSALYKFNGNIWIEVDKGLSDQHAYDDAYIDHLIDKIDSGEYDPELLSDAERDRIEYRLKNNPKLGRHV